MKNNFKKILIETFKGLLLESLNVKLSQLYMPKEKLEETFRDIAEGIYSKSSWVKTLNVEQIGKDRFLIIDGHHLLIEAIFAEKKTLRVNVNTRSPERVLNMAVNFNYDPKKEFGGLETEFGFGKVQNAYAQWCER